MISKNCETGRSMVEMLGVLAVIGVLSIAGIMGYSYAMDKYHANETINDVNLRAMDLISQLSHGITPTLASWDETGTAGYPISLDSDEAPTNYYIKVEKVPFRVCDIISDTMPESVEILIDNENEKCATGENVMDFLYTVSEDDFCPTGTSTKGLGGYVNVSGAKGNRCYCKNTGTKWDDTTSTCVTQDGSCSSFSDCNKGEYCQFDTTKVTLGNPPSAGTCYSISECANPKTYNEFWMADGAAISMYAKNCKPDWWTAQDICSAQGMSMISLSDIGCENYKNAECPSKILTAIQEIYPNRVFWTYDPHDLMPNMAWRINGSSVSFFSCTDNSVYSVLCHQ